MIRFYIQKRKKSGNYPAPRLCELGNIIHLEEMLARPERLNAVFGAISSQLKSSSYSAKKSSHFDILSLLFHSLLCHTETYQKTPKSTKNPASIRHLPFLQNHFTKKGLFNYSTFSALSLLIFNHILIFNFERNRGLYEVV